jgi:HlyD family secretion protein
VTEKQVKAPPRRFEVPTSMDIPRAPQKKRKPYIIAGAAAVAFAIIWYLTGRLSGEGPSVPRDIVIIDTVKQGAFVRDVRASGTLVPERVRIIAALTAGRVEKLPVPVSSTVQPGTVLVELSNPDVELQALEAQRSLVAAKATLASLRTSLETGKLAQTSIIASTRTQHGDAQRNLRVLDELIKINKRMVSDSALEGARQRVKEQTTRLEVEEKKLELLTASAKAEIALQEDQVRRLQSIADFQERRVKSMQVTSGEEGVLQSLPLEYGQWVLPGTELGRVVQPGRLKAVLRVSQADQRDVTVGQPVSIDTRTGGQDAVVRGRVVRIDPSLQNGTVAVDVLLEGTLPVGARPDLAIDGTVELERIPSTLVVSRPTGSSAGQRMTVFRVTPDGRSAVRVPVHFGRAASTAIEVVDGLKPGDRIIVSDMSQYANAPSIRLR